MMRYKRILIILLELLSILPRSRAGVVFDRPDYSTDLETTLRSELFTNYEVLQRPTERVSATISLTLLTVNAMNIKDQVLSISGYLSVNWPDPRLDWSNTSSTTQDYSNVKFLFSTEEYVWRPALVIENAVSEIKIISDKTIPMRILSGGIVIWNPAGIYEVSCESDTTYYPLDTQECSIKVTSWAYTSGEVMLILDGPAIDLSFYSANGEWDLISTDGEKPDDKSRGGTSFSALTFKMKLRRRPMFHILNTLFPVALMAVLIAMVFKLSVDSGEKIGFSLTVLLAYAVYLTMISDNIPSTSVTICYLSLYLVFILSLASISVILTIFVLSLHHKTEEDQIPKWVKTLTSKCLLKLALMEKCGKCSKKTKIGDSQLFDKVMPLSEKPAFPDETDEKDGITWQQLSKIMDKVFFNMYIVLIVLSTGGLFTVVLNHYYS